jgi:hypothetical protein
MYVKVYTQHNGHWEPWCVLELSKTELKRRKREYPRQLHLTITGAEAHTWVRKAISTAPGSTSIWTSAWCDNLPHCY